MLHQNEALICWLQKIVLSCTVINGELHQKMVKSSDKSTKIWCNTGRIFVTSKSVLFFLFFFLVQHRSKMFRVYCRKSAKLAPFFTIGYVNILLLRRKSAKLASFFGIGCVNIHSICWKSSFFSQLVMKIYIWFAENRKNSYISHDFRLIWLPKYAPILLKFLVFFFPGWSFEMHNFSQLLS